MNKRIQELLHQCSVPDDQAENYSKSKGLVIPDQKLDVAKFAELIVRECCIALNPMLRDMISRGQGVDLIKLHFGMNPKEITTAMLDASIAQCEQELAKKKSGVEE
jgi:hypothetical protein